MKRKLQWLLYVVVMTSMVLLSACGGNDSHNASSNESTNKETKEDINIGAYGPLSGPTAQYGDSMKKNIEMYIEEVNSNGGINGRKIKLIVEDDEGKADKGINAVKKLISKDKVVAVLGGPLSTVNLAVMKETQKAKVPHIATSSGNPKITESGNPYITRVVTKDTAIAETATKYIVEEAGYSKVAILYSADEYGKAGGEAAIETLELLNLEPVAEETFNPGDKDYTPQLLKFKEAGAEAIIYWGFYVDGAIVARQMAELDLDAQLIGGTGLNNPQFVELASDESEGVLFVSPFVSTVPRIQEYVNTYKEKYGATPDMSGATGYDAAQLIVAAIKEVGTDQEKINDWLHNVQDFQGVTGILNGTEGGDLNTKAKVITIHKDGTQTIAWDPDQE